MLIVCAIYYSVIPNSRTGFGNGICVAPKAFLNLFNFSMFFSSFFLGGNERDAASLSSYNINTNAFRCPLGATY